MTRFQTTTILLIAAAIRLPAGVWWQGRLPEDVPFRFPDSHSYWNLAGSIARGEPYQWGEDRRVFRTPGYPALLAPLFWASRGEPPVLAARALSAVLGVAAVAGVMWLASMLFDRRAALWAGLFAAVYPGAIAMSSFVLSEAPFCPFMILHLGCWVLAWKDSDRKRQWFWAGAGGVAAAVATLMRPSWLLFIPFALALAVAFSPSRWRHLQLGLAMIIGFALAMCPWWVRNYRVTGSFVPTTLQVGESLYDGLHPEATGASDMQFVDEFREQLQSEDAAGVNDGDPRCFEQRLDLRMRDAALAWAGEHPQDVLRLAGVKFLRIWNFWPNEPSFRNWLFRIVVLAGYVPLLSLGIAGVARFARRGWPYVLCFLPAVYFTCLHMIFVGSLRYRQPAMLVLIVLAAGCASLLWNPSNRENELRTDS